MLEEEINGRYRGEKRRVVFVYVPLLLVASFVGSTLLGEKTGGGLSVLDVLTSLGLNFLTLLWVRLDSNERRYELHRLFTFAVIIFGVFALLYYFFTSRGSRGGFVALAWLLLYLAALFLVVTIASLLVLAVLISAGFVTVQVFE